MAGVGDPYLITLENNLWDIETTGQEFATNEDTPPTNFGLSTYEMKQTDSYNNLDWNFEDIWIHNLDHNFGYPYLQYYPDVIISFRPQNLEGEQINNIINLSWEAPLSGSSGTLERYNIYRNDEFLSFTTALSYIDHTFDLEIENTYYVTIVYLSPNGESAASNVFTTIAVSCDDETDIPSVTTLKGNYPNPFNPETNISFSLSAEVNLHIDIYNIKGQKVKSLVDDIYQAGEYNIIWKGNDDNGNNVGSGIYFYRMQAGEYVRVRKMVMMK